MRRLTLLGFALGFLVAALPALGTSRQQDVTGMVKVLNGSPTFLGTIAVHDAGTTNNWTTPLVDAGVVTPFDAGFGNQLLIQCDQDTWIKAGSGTTVTASTSGVKVLQDEKYHLLLKSDQATIAIKGTTAATAYCDIYMLE